MTIEKAKPYLIGALWGAVIGFFALWLLQGRYTITVLNPATVLKTDKLTGESWQSFHGQPWQKIGP